VAVSVAPRARFAASAVPYATRAARGKTSEKARGEPRLLLRVDEPVDHEQSLGGIALRCPAQPALLAEGRGGDVGDRDDARQSARRRRQEPVEAPAEHGDRVTAVIRLLATRRKAEDYRRARPWRLRRGLERRDRRTARHPVVQQRVAQLASDERGACLLAARRGPIRRHEQSDGAAIREPLEIIEPESRYEHDAKFLRRRGGRTGRDKQHEGRQGQRSYHRRKVQSELPHRPRGELNFL
jgi:hypothetical protein